MFVKQPWTTLCLSLGMLQHLMIHRSGQFLPAALVAWRLVAQCPLHCQLQTHHVWNSCIPWKPSHAFLQVRGRAPSNGGRPSNGPIWEFHTVEFPIGPHGPMGAHMGELGGHGCKQLARAQTAGRRRAAVHTESSYVHTPTHSARVFASLSACLFALACVRLELAVQAGQAVPHVVRGDRLTQLDST